MSSDTSCQDRQKRGPSLKTVMSTLLFRNVITPASRQILGHPSLSSLHGRAGLHLSEDMVHSLCFYDYTIKLKEEELVSTYIMVRKEIQKLTAKRISSNKNIFIVGNLEFEIITKY